MDPKLAFESTMMFLAKALHSILNRLAAKRKMAILDVDKKQKRDQKKNVHSQKCLKNEKLKHI